MATLLRTSSPRSCGRVDGPSARAASNGSSPNTACKKKLHQCRPGAPEKVRAQVTSQVVRDLDSDPGSLERGVRQRLADKTSDTLVGLWLLVPEHLRLGTWDLLCGWTGQLPVRVEPRLAVQLVH